MRQLHALSGDEFTLFPGEQRPPPPLECSGSTDRRFVCLTEQAKRLSAELDMAGGFAVATADGNIRAFAQGDALNQGSTSSTRTRGPPPLLPPGFRFVFPPGAEQAQYVVTRSASASAPEQPG